MLKSDNSSQDKHLRILDIVVDAESGTVWRDGKVIDLPELSFRLLVALATRAPAMVSKDELIAAVWCEVVVSDETLMQRISLLRQSLGDDSQNPRYIASVRGRGYRLMAPVESGTTPDHPAQTPNSRRWLLGAAICLLILTAIGLTIGPQDEPRPATISTLAVLPFSDLSEDKNFGFFADGMQEELLARLARIEEVSVLSRTSVERFRGTTDSIPDISSSLNADGIIEGSVRLSDNRLRITVQLIAGETDEHLWAESYEEELTVENVFAIQERVANSIAEALQAEYHREQSALLGLPTSDIEAYNLYLLGRYHTFRQTPDNLDLAVQYLEQAVDRDPEFAEAYATLGWAYSFLGTGYGQREPSTVYPRAREAALRALELDDQMADAHSLYADILTWYDWNFELAEIEYRRTIMLDPTNVLGYALFLSAQGRDDEAIEMVERRIEASPNDEYVWVNAGWRYLRADRFDDAMDAATRAHGHPDAANLLGEVMLAQGEFAEAISIFEDDLDRQGRGQIQLVNLAYAYFKAGRATKAQPLLDELEAQADTRFVPPLLLATLYFAAGDEERGYELLESAVEARQRAVIFLSSNRALAEQRDDPRFIAILEQVRPPAKSR